jgi:predicted Zn-dependent protease with MMP-like domain
LKRTEFEALVERGLALVPARFRRLLANLIIVVEDESSDPDLLGFHETNPPFPDRIVIFQGPHERQARSPENLERLVAETVFHEIGHYLGMDEAQVARMEVGRRRRLARRTRGSILPGR